MHKMLFLFMVVPILLCSQAGLLPDLFQEAQMIKIFNEGQEIVISEQTKQEFDKLFVEAISNSRQMPAFGVSIHKLTIEEMKSGIWIKFIYDKTMQACNMPFDELLIHIQKDMHGVNVIRGNDGIYNGRCFYLELENSFDAVYEFLSNLQSEDVENEVEVELDIQEEKSIEIVENNENNDDDNGDDNGESDNKFENPEEPRDSAEVLVEKVSQFDELETNEKEGVDNKTITKEVKN